MRKLIGGHPWDANFHSKMDELRTTPPNPGDIAVLTINDIFCCSGGGVFAHSFSWFTMHKTLVSQNEAGEAGGGIVVMQGKDLELLESTAPEISTLHNQSDQSNQSIKTNPANTLPDAWKTPSPFRADGTVASLCQQPQWAIASLRHAVFCDATEISSNIAKEGAGVMCDETS